MFRTYLSVRKAQSQALPFSFEEALTHLRMNGTSEQSQEGADIIKRIVAARDRAEALTNTQLMKAEFTLTLPGWWQGELYLDAVPFVDGSVTIQYRDAAGELVNLAEGNFEAIQVSQMQGAVELKGNLPSTTRVVISYEAGYLTAEEVPGDFIDAMKIMVSEGFDNRSDTPSDRRRLSEAILSNRRWVSLV